DVYIGKLRSSFPRLNRESEEVRWLLGVASVNQTTISLPRISLPTRTLETGRFLTFPCATITKVIV
ncbi:hypothetical protein, partial [Nostoc sp.]